MLFSTFASLLLQIVHEQRIKVNWRKVQLRECTARNQAGDAFTRIREQNIRAVCTRQCAIWLPSIPPMEKIPLLYFTQESRLFAQRGGHGHTQYDFIHVISQLG